MTEVLKLPELTALALRAMPCLLSGGLKVLTAAVPSIITHLDLSKNVHTTHARRTTHTTRGVPPNLCSKCRSWLTPCFHAPTAWHAQGGPPRSVRCPHSTRLRDPRKRTYSFFSCVSCVACRVSCVVCRAMRIDLTRKGDRWMARCGSCLPRWWRCCARGAAAPASANCD